MKYLVVDEFDLVAANHEMKIRVLNPAYQGQGRPMAQIQCSTCGEIMRLNTNNEEFTLDDLKLATMECNLHAEGFEQSEWEPGSIDGSALRECDEEEID